MRSADRQNTVRNERGAGDEARCRFDSPLRRLVSSHSMGDRQEPVGRDLPDTAHTLADFAARSRLAIYAGAGVSVRDPTGLPTGAELAAQLRSLFASEIPELTECDESDLLAVADMIEGHTTGQDIVQQAVCQLAAFTTAEPGFSHHILAFLLLDGGIQLFTTNWDTCIERALRQQRITAQTIKPVISSSDVLGHEFRNLLKVHGCATLSSTIRITSGQLDNPPLWVSSLIQAQLLQDTVVFIGVGAMTLNLDQSLRDTANATGAENTWIVDPRIGQSGYEMPWASLDPPVRANQSLAVCADSFLDDLASAYVQRAFCDILTDHDGSSQLSRFLRLAIEQLLTVDLQTLSAWTGRIGTHIAPGQSVLRLDGFVALLAAMGKMTEGDFDIDHMGFARSSSDDYLPMVVQGSRAWSSIIRDAQNAAKRLADWGIGDPSGYTVLIAGAIGQMPLLDHLTPDIAGLPSTPHINVRDAKEILENVA